MEKKDALGLAFYSAGLRRSSHASVNIPNHCTHCNFAAIPKGAGSVPRHLGAQSSACPLAGPHSCATQPFLSVGSVHTRLRSLQKTWPIWQTASVASLEHFAVYPLIIFNPKLKIECNRVVITTAAFV